jgi:hypothetical protein
MGSAPATLEASRAADAYGCFEGNDVEAADAEQAYIQADLKGNDTWVALPPDQWPDDWHDKYHRPVVKLKKALYGHPDAGTYWEEHCNLAVKAAGFEPAGEEWPSCFFHPTFRLFLMVYVGDFKMSGPKGALAGAWKDLRQKMNIEDPKPLGVFLGCDHKQYSRKLPNGKAVRCIEYDYESFLVSSLDVYKDLAKRDGFVANLHMVGTPFLVEDQRTSEVRKPQPGEHHVECPWCMHTFADCSSDTRVAAASLNGSGTRVAFSAGTSEVRKMQIAATSAGTPIDITKHDYEPGKFTAKSVASILMNLLYAARIARFDLLRAICHLACFTTKWSVECDQ